MPKLFNGNMLFVDLAGGTIEEREIDDDLFRRRIGGAPLLASLTPNESIGIAAGPLTGLPCPAGGMAVACVEFERKHRFAPILLNAGLELKLTGFDAIVIEGRSESPVYLWIRDEVADLVKADKLSGKDAWETIAGIRKEQGDQRVQVISSSKGPSASLDYVSGWDGIGFGGAMRDMNLRAIAFRGMGEIPMADHATVLSKCSEMMKASGKMVGQRSGVRSLLRPEAAARINALKRDRACFSCPYPCMSYAETGDATHQSALLMDQISINNLAKSPGDGDLTAPLVRLHRNGFCLRGDMGASNTSLDGLVEKIIAGQEGRSSADGTFDTMTEGVGEYDLIAAGYVLGVCPRFLGLMQPPLTSYCELLDLAAGESIKRETILGLGNSLMMEGTNGRA
jgi:hypothetical protein